MAAEGKCNQWYIKRHCQQSCGGCGPVPKRKLPETKQPLCKVEKVRDGGCRNYDTKKLTTHTTIDSQKKITNVVGGTPIILNPKGNITQWVNKCRDIYLCDGFVALKDGSRCWLVNGDCGSKGGNKHKFVYYKKDWESEKGSKCIKPK
jgi:hypothetical protein